MTKCTVCGEKVQWRSMDHHNKIRHPAWRRALWRFVGLVVSAGMFYFAFEILFVENPSDYPLIGNLIFIVGVVTPLYLIAYLFSFRRPTKLRRSLRAALDAEKTRDATGPSNSTGYPAS